MKKSISLAHTKVAEKNQFSFSSFLSIFPVHHAHGYVQRWMCFDDE